MLRHAYVVAVNGGIYDQVTQGRHAVAILGCDHELYYGRLSTLVGFEGLCPEETAEIPWADFSHAAPDAFIDEAV